MYFQVSSLFLSNIVRIVLTYYYFTRRATESQGKCFGFVFSFFLSLFFRFHGINERISKQNYEDLVVFYFNLIQNCDTEKLPEPHSSVHELWGTRSTELLYITYVIIWCWVHSPKLTKLELFVMDSKASYYNSFYQVHMGSSGSFVLFHSGIPTYQLWEFAVLINFCLTKPSAVKWYCD